VCGWILTLFPYLRDNMINKYAWEKHWKESRGMFDGITTSSFSYKLSSVPFIWNYLGKEIKMVFIGGMIGSYYDKVNGLNPTFGFAIVDDKKILDF